jgi:hypothetical protein
MPNFWMYVPWSDDSKLVDAADGFISRVKRMEWETYDEAEVIAQSYLRNVRNDDALYITGECGQNIEFLGSRHGKTLSARDLAEQFKGHLHPDHRVIHIWACYSGHGLAGNPNARSGLVYSFWKEMRERGFEKLTVFGYRMAVLDPLDRQQEYLIAAQILPGFTGLLTTPDKYTVMPGNVNNWRAGIGPDGKIIPPAPLPKPASLPAAAK